MCSAQEGVLLGQLLQQWCSVACHQPSTVAVGQAHVNKHISDVAKPTCQALSTAPTAVCWCPCRAFFGECDKNPGYMLNGCKKSCKVPCGPGATLTATGQHHAVDVPVKTA